VVVLLTLRCALFLLACLPIYHARMAWVTINYRALEASIFLLQLSAAAACLAPPILGYALPSYARDTPVILDGFQALIKF